MSDIIITFVVTQKVLTHVLECKPSSFFFSIEVFNKRRILEKVSNLGAHEDSFLDFSLTKTRKFSFQKLQSITCLVHCFHKLFDQSEFDVQRRQVNIFLRDQRIVSDIFLTGSNTFSQWPVPYDVMFASGSAVSFT